MSILALHVISTPHDEIDRSVFVDRQFKQSVNNLDFPLDYHLTMNEHFSTSGRTCYFKLRRQASIRLFLTNTAISTVVSAFVL